MIEKLIVYALLAAGATYLVALAAKPSPPSDGWEDRGSRKAHDEDEEKL
jgi:hypothetical protein